MPKHKKQRTQYVSKGTVGTNKKLSNAIRREKPVGETLHNKYKAFTEGKKVRLPKDFKVPVRKTKKGEEEIYSTRQVIWVDSLDGIGEYRNKFK